MFKLINSLYTAPSDYQLNVHVVSASKGIAENIIMSYTVVVGFFCLLSL